MYQVEFETPGKFAADLVAPVLPLSTVDQSRTSTNDTACE